MRPLTILALLISFSCAPTISYTTHPPSHTCRRIIPVAIDNNFSQNEKDQLFLAINDWNESLNRQMRLTLYTDRFNMEDSTISYILNANGIMLMDVPKLGSVMQNLDDNLIAITDHIGNGHKIWFVKEKATSDRIRYIALHEIAHILGASHTNSGLMKREYDRLSYSCIDWGTISQVAEFNHLDAYNMNWCNIR